jgi:hypothetical protein
MDHANHELVIGHSMPCQSLTLLKEHGGHRVELVPTNSIPGSVQNQQLGDLALATRVNLPGNDRDFRMCTGQASPPYGQLNPP